MENYLSNSKTLKQFFKNKDYECFKPYSIENNDDTVFISAGIQPLLKSFREGKIPEQTRLYLSQPVIRTQYSNSIQEGTSIAFINTTTANFNSSEYEHLKMVRDWYELLFELGMRKEDVYSKSDTLDTTWGDLELKGNRTFHYYKNLEIGDTTFFTKIKSPNCNLNLETMSDLGFGLERLKWKLSNGSYYNLYSDSLAISCEVKAYLSVIALLTVNNIKPSNKNTGYRARLYSKKLVAILNGRSFNQAELLYLNECIKYWINWQETSEQINTNLIMKEYIRNGNRYLIDVLSEEGYTNLTGININNTREEFIKRLKSSGVEEEKILKLVRER